MKIWRIACIALIAAPALAHHGRMQEHLLSAQVLSAGRYAESTAGFVRAAAHVDGSGLIAPSVQSARVPLAVGERFGFCFEVSGFTEDGEVDLQKIVTHPGIEAGGQRIDGYVNTIELVAAGGVARGCIGHTIEAADLIAGTWRIGLGAGETTLIERRFFLE